MKTRAGQKIRLTSVEELLGVANEESAMDLEIAKIQPFKDHPFKVLDDEKMQDLMESIRINGILSPVLVRPIGNDTYEMVSGHRRMHAAMMLGMDTVPAIIREMTDDEAVVKMVDANIQREELLPSEKAFAYKMKMDAMRRQAGRPRKDNCDQNGHDLSGRRSRDVLADELGESTQQVHRYIRLPIGEAAIRKRFKKLIKDHDLPDVVFHSLRHTSHTSVTYKMKLNGGDIKAVQGDSGHAQVNMVTDVYSHILDEDRKRNAELFEEAFYGKKNLNPQMIDAGAEKMITVPDGVDAETLMKVLGNPEMVALLSSLAKTIQK